MRPLYNYILTLHRISLAVCFLILALGAVRTQAQAQPPPHTAAQDKVWTTVGSTGTVDETDVSKVFFAGSVVQMGQPFGNTHPVKKSALIPTTIRSAVIRYNITPVEGLFAFDGFRSGMGLTLRYLSTDTRTRVVAKLIEVDLTNGVETTRATFDSRAPHFQVSNSYQVQSVVSCGGSGPFMFNFSDKAPGKAYYIEATLTAPDGIVTGSAAGIQIIKVANVACIT